MGFVDLEFMMLMPLAASLMSSPTMAEITAFTCIEVMLSVWHARLGNAGGDFIKRLDSIALGVTPCKGELDICEACIIGKHLHGFAKG